LLILDMLSEFDFPDGPRLVVPALAAARRIAKLRARAARLRWPVIYVNDAPGTWESDKEEFLRRCASPGARGSRIAKLLEPTARDYFLFKPRHSAFFETALNSLLSRLHIRRLVLTGTTAHQCVLFTAMDAHIRGYQVIVPRAGVASPQKRQTTHALAILKDAVEATIW
jgi:nicotinamidase-related amidase